MKMFTILAATAGNYAADPIQLLKGFVPKPPLPQPETEGILIPFQACCGHMLKGI